MLTVKSIGGIGRFIKLGSKIKAVPFHWNQQSSRFEAGSRKQRIIMATIIIYMYFEAAYHIYRLVKGYKNKSVPFDKYMKLVDMFVTRTTALLLQTIVLVYYKDIKYFMNQLLNLNTRFIEIYGHNHTRDPCAKFYSFWFWFVTIHPVVTAIVYAVDNKDLRYWHGALLPAGIQPFFVPLLILVEYWFAVFCELGCASLGSILVAYYKTSPVWMNELVTMVRKRKTKCEQIVNLYRGLLILNRAFNSAFSLVIACGFFALLVDMTVALTCSLRVTPVSGLSGITFPISSLAIIFATEVTIRPSANLTTPSTDFLAAFSEVISIKRCGNKQRGHVKNLEKERKKFMKINRRYNAKTSDGSEVVDVLEHGSSDNRRSSLDETQPRISIQKSQFASHKQTAMRHEDKQENESDIDLICTGGMDMVDVLPERKTFLELPGLVNVDILENRSSNHMSKASSRHWDETISRIHGHSSDLASHFQPPRRDDGGKRPNNQDSIEVICTDERDMRVVMSPEKRRSLLRAATAKSMYPIAVNCFIFFEFENSTIFNFYSTVLDQTISALLVT